MKLWESVTVMEGNQFYTIFREEIQSEEELLSSGTQNKQEKCTSFTDVNMKYIFINNFSWKCDKSIMFNRSCNSS